MKRAWEFVQAAFLAAPMLLLLVILAAMMPPDEVDRDHP